jgi:hypothetical protein
VNRAPGGSACPGGAETLTVLLDIDLMRVEIRLDAVDCCKGGSRVSDVEEYHALAAAPVRQVMQGGETRWTLGTPSFAFWGDCCGAPVNFAFWMDRGYTHPLPVPGCGERAPPPRRLDADP